MCQWRQWLPNNFDRLSSYCATSPATGASFPLRWMWGCSVLCCPLLETLHNGGSECSVWHRGIIWLALLHKGQPAPLCSMPFSTSPRTRSRLRETLAFELLFCHFLLLENRERRGLTHIPPSARAKHPPEWVSAHTVISVQRSWLQSGSKSDFVSKAAWTSRHSNTVIWTVRQSKSPTASSFFSLLKTIAAFTTTLDL